MLFLGSTETRSIQLGAMHLLSDLLKGGMVVYKNEIALMQKHVQYSFKFYWLVKAVDP